MAAIVTVIVMKLEDQAKQLDEQAATVDGRLTELSSQLDVKLAKQLEVIRQDLTQMVDTKLGDLERSIVHKVRKKIADPCAEIHRAVDEKIEATFQKTLNSTLTGAFYWAVFTKIVEFRELLTESFASFHQFCT